MKIIRKVKKYINNNKNEWLPESLPHKITGVCRNWERPTPSPQRARPSVRKHLTNRSVSGILSHLVLPCPVNASFGRRGRTKHSNNLVSGLKFDMLVPIQVIPYYSDPEVVSHMTTYPRQNEAKTHAEQKWSKNKKVGQSRLRKEGRKTNKQKNKGRKKPKNGRPLAHGSDEKGSCAETNHTHTQL